MAEFVLATATVKPEHDIQVLLPPMDEFVAALSSGDPPCFTGASEAGLTCTPAQLALLPPFITAFNDSTSVLARFAHFNAFLLEATAAEINAGAQTVDGVACRVARYDLAPGESPETVYYVEDYPNGRAAHGKTLAVGVMRWFRFVAKLVDLKVDTFSSADDRDAALRMRQPGRPPPDTVPAVTTPRSGTVRAEQLLAINVDEEADIRTRAAEPLPLTRIQQLRECLEAVPLPSNVLQPLPTSVGVLFAPFASALERALDLWGEETDIRRAVEQLQAAATASALAFGHLLLFVFLLMWRILAYILLLPVGLCYRRKHAHLHAHLSYQV